MADYVEWLTTQTILAGDVSDAMKLAEHMRTQVIRLDRIVADRLQSGCRSIINTAEQSSE